MHIIAEGVENESQLLSLHDLGCDEVQGYLLSRPLSAKLATEFFDSTSIRRMIRKMKIKQKRLNHTHGSVALADILNSPPQEARNY